MVKKFMTVVRKETIIDVANSIDGIQVDDDGNVLALTRDGSEIFDDLYQKYRSIGGGVAKVFTKQAIRPIMDSNPGLTVPDELR